MWGTSSHGDELTGNLANELDAIPIDDRGLLRLFAEKSSRVDLGLLQHNLPITDTTGRPFCKSPPLDQDRRCRICAFNAL